MGAESVEVTICGVCVNGSGRMTGVAVTIPGVLEGTGLQIGTGSGSTFHTSQAVRIRAKHIETRAAFFIH